MKITIFFPMYIYPAFNTSVKIKNCFQILYVIFHDFSQSNTKWLLLKLYHYNNVKVLTCKINLIQKRQMISELKVIYL